MMDHQELDNLPSSGHQELIERVLFGDLSPEANEIRSLRENCPACQAQLTQHAEIAALLNQGGNLERDSILKEALELDQFPGDERADAILYEVMSSTPPSTLGGGRWTFRSLPALIAAAALLIAVFALREQDADQPFKESATHLGPSTSGGQDQLPGNDFGPTGQVENYMHWYWDDTLPEDGLFILSIFSGSADQADSEALFELELLEGKWTPTEQEYTSLPDSIRVVLETENRDGQRIASRSWSARRP